MPFLSHFRYGEKVGCQNNRRNSSKLTGSNIFNIAFVLGASAVISPLTVNIVSVYDILILLVVSALSLYFARTQRRFSRIEGILMLGMYALYCGYIFVR